MRSSRLSLCVVFLCLGYVSNLMADSYKVIEETVAYKHSISYYKKKRFLKRVLFNRCFRDGYMEVTYSKAVVRKEKEGFKLELLALCGKPLP